MLSPMELCKSRWPGVERPYDPWREGGALRLDVADSVGFVVALPWSTDHLRTPGVDGGRR